MLCFLEIICHRITKSFILEMIVMSYYVSQVSIIIYPAIKREKKVEMMTTELEIVQHSHALTLFLRVR